MPNLLGVLALLVALGMWAVGWILETSGALAFAVVLSAPLLALAARVWLPPLVGQSASAVRQLAYRDIEGRHFDCKGRAMRVGEDMTGDRWVCVCDIRKIVPGLPRDQVLQRLFPQSLGRAERWQGLFLQAQALDGYLQRSRDDASIRFRQWLQREVIFPAQRAHLSNRVLP